MSVAMVLENLEARFADGDHLAQLTELETYRQRVHHATDIAQRATWYVWMGFLSSLTGKLPDIVNAYCLAGRDMASAHRLYDLQAMADSCLAQSALMTGDFSVGFQAGHRALATFQVLEKPMWACRTLWHLSTLANAVGAWEHSRRYCEHALMMAQQVDDERMQSVSLWHIGATLMLQGRPQEGLRWCEDACSFTLAPYDTTTIRGMQAYGLIKVGDRQEGTRQLIEAVAYFDHAHLRYTQLQFTAHLAVSYAFQGERDQARRLGMDLAIASQRMGYCGLEKVGRQCFRASFEAYNPLMYEREDHVASSGEDSPRQYH